MARCRPALLCNSDRFPFQSLDPSKAKLCKPLLSKPFCQLNRPIVQHCLNHDYCSDQCLFSTPILQLSRSGHIHSLTIGLVFVRSVPFWFRSKILCPPLVLLCSKSPAPLFWSENIWPLPFLIWWYLPPWFWPNEGAVGVWGSFWSMDIYPSLVLFWVWGGSGIRGGYEDVSHSLALIKKYWPFPLFWSQIDLRMREQWGFEEDMKEALWNSKVFQCDDDNDRKRDNHQNNYALWNWKQFKRIIMMIVIIAMKTMLSGTWRHFKRNLGDSRTWRSIRSIHC